MGRWQKRIHGLSAAHVKTNEMLEQERIRLADSAYADALKEEDPCLKREYADGREIVAVPSDIAFTDKMTLKLGGLTADMFHGISPHSEDTVLVHIPEEKVLFLGIQPAGIFIMTAIWTRTGWGYWYGPLSAWTAGTVY